jgi:hypothetical protein
MEEEAVRWNIKVSKETDLTLRTFVFAKERFSARQARCTTAETRHLRLRPPHSTRAVW